MSAFPPRRSHFSQFHPVKVSNFSRYTRFYWCKIWFERFNLCKKNYILQLSTRFQQKIYNFIWVWCKIGMYLWKQEHRPGMILLTFIISCIFSGRVIDRIKLVDTYLCKRLTKRLFQDRFKFGLYLNLNLIKPFSCS